MVPLKINAVLLDVGNVLVDETELYKMYQNQLLELLQDDGIVVSRDQMKECLQQFWQRGLSNYRAAILWQFVKPDIEKFRRLRKDLKPLLAFYEAWKPKLIPGAKEAVASLSQKYRLALAGNQPTQIKRFLQSQDILQYFEYDLVSEEMGVTKPDPLFFQIILDHLGVSPPEAVMVGDRVDNDIAPAKRLRLKTIRFLFWPFSLQNVHTALEMPDWTIHELSELPKILAELSERK